MIDYHSTLVSALKTVLPDVELPNGDIQSYVHYELVLHSGLPTPCISYQEANNYDTTTGETFGYSKIAYTVKVWGRDIAEIQRIIKLVDKALRPHGFKRTSTNELSDKNSSMIQKIMQYEADASEDY